MRGICMTKGTLLIAEDEIDFRNILVELTKPFADEVLTATNGKEALQLVKSGKVDAVLTDIKMPLMTGLQFLAETRSLLLQTPVIVLTGFGDVAAYQEAIRLDATDLLEKPCDHSLIETAVKKALAYGMALRNMEIEIDQLYADSNLPADSVAKIKKIRRLTQGMKLGFSSYTKKAS